MVTTSSYERDAFKFCMVCGSDFETVSNVVKQCTHCAYRYYIASKPSASALIFNSKYELLLIKRARDPCKGTWDVPAGFADDIETLEDALKREMKEEANLDVKKFTYFKSYVGDYDYKGVIKRYLSACFIIHVSDRDLKTITAGDDAAELKWVALDKINFDELSFPATKQRIKDYIQFLKIKK
ncbi:NUDIX domain-containing protein [Candidatus Woesearchaeota archaeon]|nr:NUDIX domain-containing protein [Candidatus Woesearchaeota archaeon]